METPGETSSRTPIWHAVTPEVAAFTFVPPRPPPAQSIFRASKYLRPRKACDTCRRRKVKCDGSPACSGCRSLDVPCTRYSAGQLTRKKYQYAEVGRPPTFSLYDAPEIRAYSKYLRSQHSKPREEERRLTSIREMEWLRALVEELAGTYRR